MPVKTDGDFGAATDMPVHEKLMTSTTRRTFLAAAVVTVLMVLVSCGTMVRVVDELGAPVAGAQIELVYPSINGPSVSSAADGRARLADAWFRSPLFGMRPVWVWVRTEDGRWQFDYPPPTVLCLGPANRFPQF